MSAVAVKGNEMTRRNDASVKIDEAVVRMARLVAEYKEITIAEYLTELIRPLVERDLQHEQANFRLPKSRPEGKPKRNS